jgi:hypothetical protein
MSSFRRGFNRGNNNTNRKFEDEILIFKEGVPHTWLQNFLTEQNTTRFRILPAFTDGEEEIALNPDADQDTSMSDLFGYPAAVLELATGIGERRLTYISGNYEDNEGRKVEDSWSVTKNMLARLKFKLRDTALLEEHGRKDLVDIPPSWRRWLNGNFRKYRLSDPKSHVCFQVVAAEINGAPVEDGRGNKTWGGPYFFAVRLSAMDQFLQDLRTKADPSEPLTLKNNIFGDFCSLEGGQILMLRKIQKADAKNGSTNAAYNLKPVGGAFPLKQDYVEKTFVDWDELVNVPTIEQAIELFASTFDGIAVDFALRDSRTYSEYIPQDYRGLSADIGDPTPKSERLAMLGVSDGDSGGYSQGQTAAPAAPAAAPNIPLPPMDDLTGVPSAPAAPSGGKTFRPGKTVGGKNVGGTVVNLESPQSEQDFEQALAAAQGNG